MRQVVESIKRLFHSAQIDEIKVNEMYQKGTINEKERNYILGKEE